RENPCMQPSCAQCPQILTAPRLPIIPNPGILRRRPPPSMSTITRCLTSRPAFPPPLLSASYQGNHGGKNMSRGLIMILVPPRLHIQHSGMSHLCAWIV
ncbi:hypothetical protein JB92DRAFT_3014235, partial [Gautieria morchelliformis]